MMTVSPSKWTGLASKSAFGQIGSYQILLYGRALHPEPFQLRARRVVPESKYQIEGWLMRGGHVLCFRRGLFCCSELVTGQDRSLPTTGVVNGFQCNGEQDYEHRFTGDAQYFTSVQAEPMNETLYRATYEELVAFGQQRGALTHTFEDECGPCLSMLDFEPKARSVHVDSYHLIANGGIVLKTQSLIEIA